MNPTPQYPQLNHDIKDKDKYNLTTSHLIVYTCMYYNSNNQYKGWLW